MPAWSPSLSPEHACLRLIVNTVLELRPQHAKYLARSIAAHSQHDLDVLERGATDICALAGSHLHEYCRNYHWMCETFNREAIHFARTGEYRCKTFEQATREVYANQGFMKQYMDGLLISQVLWANHAKSFIFFVDHFLPALQGGSKYLEIGPGHGLFLAQVARNSRVAHIEAWDVSRESLAQTRGALETLDVDARAHLSQRDVRNAAENSASNPSFDAIAISEVLEHMEDPLNALTGLRHSISDHGMLLVNVPVNSPAPDHIYLLQTPEEARRLVESAGFQVFDFAALPMSGYNL
ncbi:MAG: methyltransferase domain-containing protein, partial [Chloroflexi bacterium]|nr:methyltransferase domain-containing protein [Chloroflexota bacterium]